jgi:hypothetical protein
MNEILIKKLGFIKMSAEILLEHHQARGFKNTMMETGLKNILEIAQEAIYEIQKEKAPEPPKE